MDSLRRCERNSCSVPSVDSICCFVVQCLRKFDEKDAVACLDVVSDMAESPLPFLFNAVDATARCMAQVGFGRWYSASRLCGARPKLRQFFLPCFPVQIMAHSAFEIHTRDCAGLVLRNLIEMKPKTIGKKGVVPEVSHTRERCDCV